MKFVVFTMFNMDKAAEMGRIGDTVKIPGNKLEGWYLFQGRPFDGVPPNTAVSLSIHDVQSNADITALEYPLAKAGATVWAVPVMEIPRGGAVKQGKEYMK
jgi:hypothetical protein